MSIKTKLREFRADRLEKQLVIRERRMELLDAIDNNKPIRNMVPKFTNKELRWAIRFLKHLNKANSK